MMVVRPLDSMPPDAAAAAVEVAHEGSGKLVGGFDFDLHDGFEQAGLGRFHGLAEGDAAGHLEGHFVGVNVVVAAVVDGGLEVDDRVAGEIAAGGGLDDALFDGGDEVAGDGAAEDFVAELEAAAAGQWLHANLAVAELAVAAGLLLVASRRLDLGADGLAVRHLGRFERDLGVVALFEAADDGLDVRLAGAGDEELVGLRVAEEADEQVFFHELVNGGGELVFVGAGLGLDGVGHGRLGQRMQIDLDVGAFDAKGVAGEGVAQLGHGAQVAGVQLGNFDGLAALHHGEVRKALLAAARVVFDGGVVLDDAADDLEEGDAAGEGVGHGLEDHQCKRLLVFDFAGGLGGVGIFFSGFDQGLRAAMGARSTGAGV